MDFVKFEGSIAFSTWKLSSRESIISPRSSSTVGEDVLGGVGGRKWCKVSGTASENSIAEQEGNARRNQQAVKGKA